MKRLVQSVEKTFEQPTDGTEGTPKNWCSFKLGIPLTHSTRQGTPIIYNNTSLSLAPHSPLSLSLSPMDTIDRLKTASFQLSSHHHHCPPHPTVSACTPSPSISCIPLSLSLCLSLSLFMAGERNLLLLLPLLLTHLCTATAAELPAVFREAPAFRNGRGCAAAGDPAAAIHIAMTLDMTYLRGSLAGILSVLQHASCPENIVFHFLASSPRRLRAAVLTSFPYLSLRMYRFDPALVRGKISSSVRRALDQPLNYARIYLADLLPGDVARAIYLDSDLIVVDDIAKLWGIDLAGGVLGAPEYCHANFTAYFTDRFWADERFARVFEGRRRRPCYFNSGVMVMDLERWRRGGYTGRVERWMRVQKREARIYELGSLPPFLLVFAGEVAAVEHRWNQHGLGGDNLEGLCRDLHPGPVSLLHWSGKGKPWLRLDAGRPCPLDSLWAPYDLLRRRGADDLLAVS